MTTAQRKKTRFPAPSEYPAVSLSNSTAPRRFWRCATWYCTCWEKNTAFLRHFAPRATADPSSCCFRVYSQRLASVVGSYGRHPRHLITSLPEPARFCHLYVYTLGLRKLRLHRGETQENEVIYIGKLVQRFTSEQYEMWLPEIWSQIAVLKSFLNRKSISRLFVD